MDYGPRWTPSPHILIFHFLLHHQIKMAGQEMLAHNAVKKFFQSPSSWTPFLFRDIFIPSALSWSVIQNHGHDSQANEWERPRRNSNRTSGRERGVLWQGIRGRWGFKRDRLQVVEERWGGAVAWNTKQATASSGRWHAWNINAFIVAA